MNRKRLNADSIAKSFPCNSISSSEFAMLPVDTKNSGGCPVNEEGPNEIAVFSDDDPFVMESTGNDFVVRCAISKREFQGVSSIMLVFVQSSRES